MGSSCFECLIAIVVAVTVAAFLVYRLFLRLTAHLWRRYFEGYPGRAGVCTPDEIIIYLNPIERARLGDGVRKVKDYPDIDYPKISSIIADVFKTGKGCHYEYTTGIDEMHCVTFTKVPRLILGRQAVLWVSYNDTLLKQAMGEARRSSEWLRLTFNSIGDGVLTTDATGKILSINPVAERMLGVKTAEAVGLPHEKVFRIVSYLNDEPMISAVYRAIRTGSIVELANHTDLLSRDGKRYHISDSAAPIRDSAGKIAGAILVFRDVTEEYEQRDHLRSALELMESGTALTNSATFSLNIKDYSISGSALLPQLLPIRDGKLVSYANYVLAEDAPAYAAAREKLLTHAANSLTWNYRSAYFGELRYYRISMTMNWRDSDSPCVHGAVQDITEVTRAVGRLRATQEMWGLVIESLPVMLFVKSVKNDFRYVLSNRAFAEFLGRTPAQIVGRTDAELFGLPQDAKNFLDWDRKTIESGKTLQFFEDSTNSRGIRRHIRTTKMPFRGTDGEPMLLGICSDVTEMSDMLKNAQAVSNVLESITVEADFALDVDLILQTVMRELSPDRVVIAKYDSTADCLRYFRALNRKDGGWNQAIVEKYREGFWRYFLTDIRANRFIHLENAEAEVPAMRAAFEEEPNYPARSIMATAIFVKGRLWGMLLLAYSKIRIATDSDEKLMRSMANIIAIANYRDESRRNHEVVTACLQTLVREDKMSDAVQKVLQAVCERLGASRIFMVRFNTQARTVSTYAEYTAAGRKPFFVQIHDKPYSTSKPDWESLLKASPTILIEDVLKDGPEHGLDATWLGFCRELDLRSIFVNRIFMNDSFMSSAWGYVAITYEGGIHRLTELDAPFIASVAQFLELMIIRERAHEIVLRSRDAAQAANAEARASLEKMAATNTCLETLFSENNYDQALAKVLQTVAEYYQASHCYSVRLDIQHGTEKVTHSYSASGVNNALAAVPAQPVDLGVPWLDDLMHHRHMGYPDVGAPEAAKALRDWIGAIREFRIKSLYGFPIFKGDELWGDLCIIFTGERGRTLSEADLQLLGNAARMMEIILLRQQASQQILAALDEARAANVEAHTSLQEVEATNTCLAALFQEEDLDQALTKVVETLGRHYHATHAYCYCLDFKTKMSELRYSYTAAGFPPVPKRLPPQPFDANVPWCVKLSRHERFAIRDINNSQEIAAIPDWEATLKAAKARSMFAYPVFVGNQLWGDITMVFMDDAGAHLAEDDLALMSSAAHMVEILLARHQNARRMKSALEQARAADAEKSVSLENVRAQNACLDTLFSEGRFEVALKKVLGIVVRHYQAAHAYCIRFDSQKKLEWISDSCSASGTFDDLVKQVKPQPMIENAPWLVEFRNHRSLVIHDFGNPRESAVLPDWTEGVRVFKLHSMYAYPIFQGDQLWGDICIVYTDDAGKRLTDENLLLLENAAHLLEIILSRQQASAQMMGALEKARAADKAKSFFVASVSHEIRTPLNAVIGFTDLLKDDALPAKTRREYLDSIAYSSNALLQLINDVLDLSKLEADQMKIIPEPCDFKALGEDVMRVFTFRAHERVLELKVEIGAMPMLELDRMRIRQILFNLIGNAVKFTRNGSVKLKAEFVKADAASGTLSAEVIDTGIGISVSDQGKLMEPFVQLSRMRGTNASNNGTGLGLAISRRLTERMGGKLWLKSEVGKGSTFGLTIPGIRVAAAGTAAAKQPTAVPAPDCSATAISQLNVLLVDDVAMNLKVMEALCRKIGVKQITAVSSGAEALEVVKSKPVCVVFTDMWMPGMTGTELTQEIRDDIRFVHLPVIAVTADVEVKDGFPNASFSGVLYKPVTLEKMRNVCSWVASGKHREGIRFF